MIITESKNVSVSFKFKGEIVKIEANAIGPLYFKVADWAYSNGFNFPYTSGPLKLLSYEEATQKLQNTPSLRNAPLEREFNNLADSNKFLIRLTNTNKNERAITRILTDFGVTNIVSDGFELRPFRIRRIASSESENYETDDSEEVYYDEKNTFVKAAQIVLKEYDNTPMSAEEIWEVIELYNLVDTKGQTPVATLRTEMMRASDNSNVSSGYKTKIFTITQSNPIKYKLIVDDFSDLDEITPFSKYPQPFDVESEMTKAQAQMELEDIPDVMNFKNFRQIQSEKDIPLYLRNKNTVSSPFKQAICVLGKSGKGKTTTIERILEDIKNLEEDKIIPDSTFTGLLSQFSASAKGGSGGYIQSRLGRIIMKAHDNPNKQYVAIFDECHKSSTIEMINDELLQCISTRRNAGRRFISLNSETSELFSGLRPSGGNLLLPDNFGFIFISSKPDVILSNSDFFNRIDLYVLVKDPVGTNVKELYEIVDGQIKLNEEFFKYFPGKEKSDIENIERTFDDL